MVALKKKKSSFAPFMTEVLVCFKLHSSHQLGKSGQLAQATFRSSAERAGLASLHSAVAKGVNSSSRPHRLESSSTAHRPQDLGRVA